MQQTSDTAHRSSLNKLCMEEHNIKVKIETLSTPATVESYKHCIQQGKQVVLGMRPVIMTDANTGGKGYSA